MLLLIWQLLSLLLMPLMFAAIFDIFRRSNGSNNDDDEKATKDKVAKDDVVSNTPENDVPRNGAKQSLNSARHLEDMRKMQIETDRLRLEARSYVDKIYHLDSEFHRLTGELKTKTELADQRDLEIVSLREQLRVLSGELAAKNVTASENRQAAPSDTIVQSLERSLKAREIRIVELQNELETMQETLASQLAAANEIIASLENTIVQRESIFASLQNEISALRRRLEVLEGSVSNVSEKGEFETSNGIENSGFSVGSAAYAVETENSLPVETEFEAESNGEVFADMQNLTNDSALFGETYQTNHSDDTFSENVSDSSSELKAKDNSRLAYTNNFTDEKAAFASDLKDEENAVEKRENLNESKDNSPVSTSELSEDFAPNDFVKSDKYKATEYAVNRETEQPLNYRSFEVLDNKELITQTSPEFTGHKTVSDKREVYNTAARESEDSYSAKPLENDVKMFEDDFDEKKSFSDSVEKHQSSSNIIETEDILKIDAAEQIEENIFAADKFGFNAEMKTNAFGENDFDIIDFSEGPELNNFIEEDDDDYFEDVKDQIFAVVAHDTLNSKVSSNGEFETPSFQTADANFSELSENFSGENFKQFGEMPETAGEEMKNKRNASTKEDSALYAENAVNTESNGHLVRENETGSNKTSAGSKDLDFKYESGNRNSTEYFGKLSRLKKGLLSKSKNKSEDNSE